MIEGVLPVLKPAGFTSHDVVAKVRRIVRERRIGHTGTLDPDVTGVLPLCLGRATRIVEYLQEMPKTYRTTLKLGIATSTEDLSGDVVERMEVVEISEALVRESLARFLGTIQQTPPMFSAVKIQGKKLYELARQGIEVERPPRTVTIHRLELLSLNLDIPYPEFGLEVECSKGTYIRTLCADIGRALGYPAVMADLIRTASGSFKLDQCISLEGIEEAVADGTLPDYLVPVDRAISHMPSVRLPSPLSEMALRGMKIPFERLEGTTRAVLQSTDFSGDAGDALVRVYSDGEQFIGIFRLAVDWLQPVKVFS
jgi:tRNA pseudouridine55 synthase